jgi:hypothetical protein
VAARGARAAAGDAGDWVSQRPVTDDTWHLVEAFRRGLREGGFVEVAASYSRPGANATGISILTATLEPKRLEPLRELVPQTSTIGAFLDPNFPPYEGQWRDLREAARTLDYDTVSREQCDASADAARKLGLEPRMIEFKGEQGYAAAFGEMDNAPGQPIILPASPIFLRERAAIAQALLKRRIPSVAAFRENTEAGALTDSKTNQPKRGARRTVSARHGKLFAAIKAEEARAPRPRPQPSLASARDGAREKPTLIE